MLKALEYMTHVSCLTMGDSLASMLKDSNLFEDEKDEK